MQGSNDIQIPGSGDRAVSTDSVSVVGCLAQVANTDLLLMPSRLVWWAEKRTLLLADSHFGKAATFRKAGLPVPVGTTERMLEVLSAALNVFEPERLVVLGDLIHSATASHSDFERELLDWRRKHALLPITLILGNHDPGRPQLLRDLDLNLRREERCGPFYFCHDPFASELSSISDFKLGGHVHPGIRLEKKSQRMPCFWQGDSFLVFPAFGAFTGLAKISPGRHDVLYAIAGDQIARISSSDRERPVRKGHRQSH